MDSRQRPRRARASRPGDDEPPRGFEPRRMRRVWDDIDQARDKLGLAPPPEAAGAAPSACLGGVLGAVAGGLGRVGAWLPGWTAATAAALSAARLATGLLGAVPVVGPAVTRLVGGAEEEAGR